MDAGRPNAQQSEERERKWKHWKIRSEKGKTRLRRDSSTNALIGHHDGDTQPIKVHIFTLIDKTLGCFLLKLKQKKKKIRSQLIVTFSCKGNVQMCLQSEITANVK